MSRRRTRTADAPLLAWGDALRAEAIRRKRLGRHIAITGAGLLAMLASTILPPVPRLIWNASASAPIGLYWLQPGAKIERGDMIIARLPAAVRETAARRHYLPLNVPLVKRAAAVPGDEICALGQHIYLNGRPVAGRLGVDRAGRPMPSWTGCVRLRGRQLFLLMDAPGSFDGRYFGVTEESDLVGKAHLLWAR